MYQRNPLPDMPAHLKRQLTQSELEANTWTVEDPRWMIAEARQLNETHRQLLAAMQRLATSHERMVESLNKSAQAATKQLTTKEVAEYLGVSDRTVETLVASGELKSYRIGSNRRVDPADLAAYIQTRKGAS